MGMGCIIFVSRTLRIFHIYCNAIFSFEEDVSESVAIIYIAVLGRDVRYNEISFFVATYLASQTMNEKEVLKKIWQREEAIKENLLKMPEPKELWDELLKMLDTLPSDSIYFLRYQKLKSKMWTWYEDSRGYSSGNPWKDMFEPFLGIFEQYQATKTLKNRFESESLFVESRVQGEDGDQHILVGEKSGDGNKAHVVVDGKTAEIRVEDNGHRAPEELITRIETILTLSDGRKIRTTREVVEEL